MRAAHRVKAPRADQLEVLQIALGPAAITRGEVVQRGRRFLIAALDLRRDLDTPAGAAQQRCLDGNEAADHAWPLVIDAVRHARTRGAVLVVFARATLAAHHRLVFDEVPADDSIALDEACAAVASFVPEAAAQRAALKSHAERLMRHMAIAEQSPDAIHVPLSNAISRFYAALAEENAAAGSRA